jgi:hypothetical protein
MYIPYNKSIIRQANHRVSPYVINQSLPRYVEGFYRTMEWADEVHRGVPGQQSRTAAIFR